MFTSLLFHWSVVSQAPRINHALIIIHDVFQAEILNKNRVRNNLEESSIEEPHADISTYI